MATTPSQPNSQTRRAHRDPTLRGLQNQGVYYAEVGQFGHVEAETIKANSTTGYVQVNSLTTTQRNALTAANGMLIYNTTDNKFQGYENGAWANLI
jgi:hypothetical protein|tara:strand:+ start:258 stop:545 length:288 start_codon:yes stop_codon:yes gene_type:complete